MKVCQFNFNNEVDSFEIHVEDDGKVTVPGENGQTMAEYESVEQLAEIYAQARDVKPENLKNWVLLENGNVYSYVLRAGTAGVDISEVEEQLEEVFENLEGEHHPLNIARAKEQIMSDKTADLTEALVHCTETDVARDVYDAMKRIFDEDEAEEPEEEDTRSELEKYLDMVEETPGGISLIAFVAGLPVDVEKAALLEALQENRILSNVGNLRAIYGNTISEAMDNGIGVVTVADAITVITQTAVGEKDDDAKNRLAFTANMAGRDKVNISVDIVGTKHIRHTAELVPVSELEDVELFVRDNVPYIVRFSDTIDEEIEAEQLDEETEADLAAMEEAFGDEEEGFDDSEDDFVPERHVHYGAEEDM